MVQGEQYRIPVYAGADQMLTGIQMALNLNGHSNVKIEGGVLEMQNHNYAIDNDGLNIPAEITKGRIVRYKNGTNRYKLVADDFESTDLSREFNPHHWGHGKLISGLLRHGMPIQFVVSTIEEMGLKDGLFTWKNGIVRALKSYIPDGTESKETCSS